MRSSRGAGMGPVTPCIGVCVVDERTGLCIGCGRTTDEIAAWPYYSDAERKALMRTFEARRKRP